MIKIALLTGLCNADVQRKVLEKLQGSEMTVDEIVDFIQQLEQVRDFIGYSSGGPLSSAEDISFARKTDVRKDRRCPQRRTIVCYRCNKPSHIARNCPDAEISSRQRGKYTNFVEAEEHESDFEDIFAVYTSKSKVISVLLHFHDRVFTLSMQEDTGSDSTFISETMWQHLGCTKLTHIPEDRCPCVIVPT